MSVVNFKQYNIVPSKKMVEDAFKGNYAVLHVNAINFDWVKSIILTAQANNAPIIVAATGSGMKHFCNAKTFVHFVADIIEHYKITVPVAVHLDHGSYEEAVAALEAGFSSVMFDGSKLPFEENYQKTKLLVELAKKTGASVEAEVGSIGGKEDGIEGKGELADIQECAKLASTGIDMLAAGIGNIHGIYPQNWKGIDLAHLEKIKQATGNMPMVLHGGSGIPNDQVKKAISLGMAKVNVATETLTAFTEELAKWFEQKKHLDFKNKNYDPRKYFPIAYKAVDRVVFEKLELCNSINRIK